jgi:uncharacterized protein DUF5681
MPKRSSSGSGDYEIGYRRPPKKYRFKPGTITNPEGINQHTAGSIARDMKRALERELNKQIKIPQGKRSITVRQTTAGISKLVAQYVEGNPRARRDLILLCEKLGVELINRDALRGALEDFLSAEDEALLADFVRRHGGQYPARADAVAGLPGNNEPLPSPPADGSKLLTGPSENPTETANDQQEKVR